MGRGPRRWRSRSSSTRISPRKLQLKNWWKLRKAARPAPLLLVSLTAQETVVCGPTGEEPPIYSELELPLLEALCREALDQPDRHAALRSLRDALPAATSPIIGIRNEGLLATHELQSGARRRPDWEQAGAKARRITPSRDSELLHGLGFQVEPLDNATSVLRTATRKEALAVLLQPQEAIETPEPRFGDKSPITYALAVADRENLRYVFVLHGHKLRLYPGGSRRWRGEARPHGDLVGMPPGRTATGRSGAALADLLRGGAGSRRQPAAAPGGFQPFRG